MPEDDSTEARPTETLRISNTADPMIGATISHYQIVEKLGQGGMGVVYRAKDSRLKRTVALKFLRGPLTHDTEDPTPFLNEARAAAALDHPNICTIYEVGEDGDRTFIAMADVGGPSLYQKLQAGPLPWDDAVEYAVQIAQGLEEAHSHGVLHGDIKPSNILISPNGSLKIIDFGVAEFVGAHLGQEGLAVGTPAYMSPEQARGEPLDGRTDLWSLGVVLYEMLTGRRPFTGDTPHAVIYAILNTAPEPLAQVPPRLWQVLEKALTKARAERCASATEMIGDLRSVRSDSSPLMSYRDTLVRRLPSIAVLPFVNLTRDTENEYFSDGLTEDLIHMLSQVEGLRVVSRTSIFEFKGRAQDIRTIGTKLSVSTVLEGTVRRLGDNVRITARLTNVADGYQIWSERYDREMHDIFAIQDEIAQIIVNRFKVKVAGVPGAALLNRQTESLTAYHLYLKGRYDWNKQTEEGFRKAIQHFEIALQEEPGYAPAYCGLADCYAYLGFWGVSPPNQVWPKAREAALKALEINDALAEAHVSLGYVLLFFDWNWREARREFQRALELSPGDAQAHYSHSLCLTQVGRLDDALKEIKRAQILDPLNLVINTGVGFVYYYSRRYERAVQEHNKTLELDADYFETHAALGLAYQAMGMYAEAIACFETARRLSCDSPLILATLGCGYGVAGKRSEALQIVEELQKISQQRYIAPLSFALVYLGLGEHEKAIEWLEKAGEARDAYLRYLKVGPIYDSLRAQPRLAGLLDRMDLSQT